jgi:hypothetical protein
MGRNCSDALNALVSRIVCAVGFREAIGFACVLPEAVLLPFVVLLEPAVFALPEPAVPVPFFPLEAVLLLLAGFAVCSVAVGLCVPPATPLQANGAIIPARQATATAPRNLLQMLVTVSSLFQPT